MSTYRASIRLDDGTLHTSRPLTAPDVVSDMIDSLVYTVKVEGAAAGLLSIDVDVETSEESGTPIGDSVSGTSQSLLPPVAADDDDVTTGLVRA